MKPIEAIFSGGTYIKYSIMLGNGKGTCDFIRSVKLDFPVGIVKLQTNTSTKYFDRKVN